MNDPAAMSADVTLCGDDLVAVECTDTRSAQALADHLRDSGEWLECVAGIASCVAQFDLAVISPEQAKQRMSSALRDVPAARDDDGPDRSELAPSLLLLTLLLVLGEAALARYVAARRG